jgi:hypothetical protein
VAPLPACILPSRVSTFCSAKLSAPPAFTALHDEQLGALWTSSESRAPLPIGFKDEHPASE